MNKRSRSIVLFSAPGAALAFLLAGCKVAPPSAKVPPPAGAVTVATPSAASGVATGRVDIGLLQGIQVDGSRIDWGKAGFRSAAPPPLPGRPPAALPGPFWQAGWNDKGMFWIFDVPDERICVDPAAMWRGDSIEVFIAVRDRNNRVKLMLAPNTDEKKTEPICELHDLSPRRQTVRIEAAAARYRDGYAIETFIPWSNFALAPQPGDLVDVEFRINDSDEPGRCRQTRWSTAAAGIAPRLARYVLPVSDALVSVRYGAGTNLLVQVLARSDLAGKSVRVQAGGVELGRGAIALHQDAAVCELDVPDFGCGLPDETLSVFVETETAPCECRAARSDFFAGLTPRSAEWPMYQADAARSGVSIHPVPFPVHTVWTYAPPQPPAPAWPEPGKENHRMDFDYAFQPVVANGLVYFGSSADDTVRALDLARGDVKWRFTAGGPIRLAPCALEGRLYVASDDGCLYCLDALNGSLTWKVRGAPNDRKLLGNGRMISRWPGRAGVLATDDTVYFCAGMWPAGGIYVYALDPATGKPIWCNDNSGTLYVNQPHGGASAFTGVTPQGYMLASDSLLLVPAGRTTPAAYDRRTGRLAWYQSYLNTVPYGLESWANRSSGGSWVLLAGDAFMNPVHASGAPDLPGRVGEAGPQPGDGLATFSMETGLRESILPDRHRAVLSGDTLYAVGGGKATAIDFAKWRKEKDMTGATRWETDCGPAYAMVLADRLLLVGGTDGLSAFSAREGRRVGFVAVGEQVRGIVALPRRILLATNKGRIVCLGSGVASAAPNSVTELPQWDVAEPGTHTDAARRLLAESPTDDGYAIVFGAPDSRLAAALAMQSRLHVINALAQSDRLDQERRRFQGNPLYGTRLCVDSVQDPRSLSYPDYFADWVVVTDGASDVAPTEFYRLLRPCGGRMCFAGMDEALANRIAEASGALPGEIRKSEAGVRIVRGRLPDAGEWRHQWADAGRSAIGNEARIRLPLEILWFGGPGPDRMMPRHWGTATPLSCNGRVFVTGSDHVLCIDAYNGREVWARELPGVGRRSADARSANFVADDDSLYAAVGDIAHRLDQARGRTLSVYRMPASPGKPPLEGQPGLEWGYLSATDSLVLGSAVPAGQDARESCSLFALAKFDGRHVWTFTPSNRVPGSSIAHGPRFLFCIDRTSDEAINRARRTGAAAAAQAALLAIDVATGQPVWRRELNPKSISVRCTADTVLVAGHGAFDAATGNPLWTKPNWTGEPVLYGDKAIADRDWQSFSPGLDLRTGEPWTVTDPVTGEQRPWRFFRAYGCGNVGGCRNLLFFRSGTFGLFDVAGEALTGFGGMRPNCSLNIVAANGLLVVPEGSSACSCSYNFQTSLALAPGGSDEDLWYVFGADVSLERVRRLRLNFGAPGDRRDGRGEGWLGYPRPVHPRARPVAIETVAGNPDFYHNRSILRRIEGTDMPWLCNSGMRGEAALSIEIAPTTTALAPRCTAPPAIDGRADDAA